MDMDALKKALVMLADRLGIRDPRDGRLNYQCREEGKEIVVTVAYEHKTPSDLLSARLTRNDLVEFAEVRVDAERFLSADPAMRMKIMNRTLSAGYSTLEPSIERIEQRVRAAQRAKMNAESVAAERAVLSVRLGSKMADETSRG